MDCRTRLIVTASSDGSVVIASVTERARHFAPSALDFALSVEVMNRTPQKLPNDPALRCAREPQRFSRPKLGAIIISPSGHIQRTIRLRPKRALMESVIPFCQVVNRRTSFRFCGEIAHRSLARA